MCCVTLSVLSSTSTVSVFFLDSVIRALLPKYLNFQKDFTAVVSVMFVDVRDVLTDVFSELSVMPLRPDTFSYVRDEHIGEKIPV
jgi:hypothetical protein